ncbi:hypothetical protein NLI96_g2607 [Meripilus lineatus]|uniref:Uncharacterized protein n=1 Tax=Meripilus lineatus TaxID=2056292 RepID=A0AAD5V8G9_9APHY|nr:hypothetical protein NLI96_g2607 [Physisporinus lineatus]
MSWAPHESSDQIWLEQATLDGCVGVASIAYGIHITLFFVCFNLLWSLKASQPKQSYFYLFYITLHFILGTAAIISTLRVNQLAFVDYRDYPGGPGVYEVDQNYIPISVLGIAASLIASWLQDGLVLYRFFVIWGVRWWVMVPPSAIFAVSMVVSCVLMRDLSQPGNTLWEEPTSTLALVYAATSMSITILSTILIVGKLLFVRYQVRNIMGKTHREIYFSVSAMLVESAFLYSAFALAFIISYVEDNTPVNQIFYQTIGQVTSIAPLLIIMRVAQGRAWSKYTTNAVTNGSGTLQFAHQSNNISTFSTTATKTEATLFPQPSTQVQEEDPPSLSHV